MTRLLLLIGALILYGSLYPWQFHPRDLSESAVEVLIGNWPGELDAFVLRDLIINVLLYIPLGAAAYLAPHPRAAKVAGVVFAAIAGASLSTAIELMQLYVANRVPSAFDIVCNLAGSIVGA